MAAAQEEVIYRIDRNGLLTALNPQWDRFAADNGCPDLAARKIRGRLLWSCIDDPETRHAHHTLLERARARGGITGLPFRCDSPTLRRYMEMDIMPLEDGGAEYRCRALRSETRARMALIGPSEATSGQLMRMCSWCKRVDLGENNWVEIEDAVAPLGLLLQKQFPRITHTICAACLKRLEEESD